MRPPRMLTRLLTRRLEKSGRHGEPRLSAARGLSNRESAEERCGSPYWSIAIGRGIAGAEGPCWLVRLVLLQLLGAVLLVAVPSRGVWCSVDGRLHAADLLLSEVARDHRRSRKRKVRLA